MKSLGQIFADLSQEPHSNLTTGERFMPTTETKRINHTTYIKVGRLLGEIKGPYRPGNVWKLEVYDTKPEFDAAWKQGKLTPVQRERCTPEQDRMFAAMCMGQTNGVDPELINHRTCPGYRYKTKREAVQVFMEKVL